MLVHYIYLRIIIFHLVPLALALVIHGIEYTFDLSIKLTLKHYDPGNEGRYAYNPRNTYKRVNSEI